METNQTSTALGQTLSSLQGGILQLGVGAAIPVVAGWEQTLAALPVPELKAVSENLNTLRNGLASGDADPAELGRLLQTLGEQVRGVATTPFGIPVAAPLTQLSLLLSTGGATLLARTNQ